MASQAKGSQQSGLVCPICLDIFKDPKILSCGHTFCHTCLASCHEQRYFHGQRYISCPVCRARTTLGYDRVAGLTPNLLVRGLLDGDHIESNDRTAFFCREHPQLYRDIFCVSCKTLICLTCFQNGHKDHEIKKKEVVEGNMRTKLDGLLQKGIAVKAEVEKEIAEAVRQRDMIRCHIGHLEVQIQDVFDQKVMLLRQNQERLLKRLDEVGAELDREMSSCILAYEYNIYQVDDPIKELRVNLTSTCLEPNVLERNSMHFDRLESFLERDDVPKQSGLPFLKKAEKILFHPSASHVDLDIGNLEIGE